MKVVVVGPGAMGCLFAGSLAEAWRASADNDVCLLDHDQSRAAAIARDGVRIEAAGITRSISVKAVSNPADAGVADLLFLCVKSFDTLAAVKYALPAIGPATLVLSLQNGVGNVEQIQEAVAPGHILRGSTALGSTLLGVGHVRHAGTGRTVISAVVASESALCEQAAEVLRAMEMETVIADDWRSVVWDKLVVNAAINALTAVHGVENGALLRDPALRAAMRQSALEAAAVAKSSRQKANDIVAEVERVCDLTGSNISSMLQDVRAGRRTEVDAINGLVVREAERLGIDVPINRDLWQQVKAMEQ